MNKKEFIKSLNLQVAQVGTEAFVFSESKRQEVEAEIKKRMLKGETRWLPGGGSEWISIEVVTNTSKEGSEAFTWSACGNKALHNKVWVKKSKEGEITREIIGTTWRKF